MAATITTYQDFIAAEEKLAYPICTEQLSALKTLFSDPAVPVSQVAKEICGPILKALEKDPESRKQYNYSLLWRTIANAIRQLTDYNDKLVELVVEIQKVPDPAGFIAFMQDFRQEWNEFVFHFRDPPSTDPDRMAKRQGWLNLNAFGAKLSTYGIPRLDERPSAASVIRNCLEKTPWENYHHADIEAEDDPEDVSFPAWRAHQLELRDIKTLNGTVPAAAVWFKINGKGLYEMEGEMGDEYEWRPTNWKGPKGWSKERFTFWRERFEWISKVTALEKETKQAAKEAAEIMREIEADN